MAWRVGNAVVGTRVGNAVIVGLPVGTAIGASVLSQHASYRPVAAAGQHVPDVRPAATQRACLAHMAQPEPQKTLAPAETKPLSSAWACEENQAWECDEKVAINKLQSNFLKAR